MKKQLTFLTLALLSSLGAVSVGRAAYGNLEQAKTVSAAAKMKNTKVTSNKKIVSFLKRKHKQIMNQEESYTNFLERNEGLNKTEKNKLLALQKKYAAIKEQLENNINKYEADMQKMNNK